MSRHFFNNDGSVDEAARLRTLEAVPGNGVNLRQIPMLLHKHVRTVQGKHVPMGVAHETAFFGDGDMIASYQSPSGEIGFHCVFIDGDKGRIYDSDTEFSNRDGFPRTLEGLKTLGIVRFSQVVRLKKNETKRLVPNIKNNTRQN